MDQLTFDLPATPRKRFLDARVDADGRQCGECREYKPWDQFHISRSVKSGHVTTCKPCTTVKGTARTEARRAARPVKPVRICGVAECNEPVSARGWCKPHYEKCRLLGKPTARQPAPKTPPRNDLPGESWRPVPTYEGLYEVSDVGRVYALPRLARDGRQIRGKFLKPDSSDPRGYLRVGLVNSRASTKQRKFGVHRLVLWAFTGENPPELDTRHLDGNPRNNSRDNLAFGTAGENAQDRVRHGTWVNNNRFVGATKCIHGHEFDEANTYWRPKGGRSCRQCMKDSRARRRAAVKAEAKEAA